jgi:hypothetical protein
VLLLVGPTPADAVRAATAEASIKRYGLKVVARKPFKLSADPRERDLANPLLLTAGASYDAVWVVDSDGEFARTLPYRTVLPRPVVGDAGLVALAWHAQFERFGAPQVVRRFYKAYKRPMTAHDWTAWMAGKALTAAAVAAPKGRTGLGCGAGEDAGRRLQGRGHELPRLGRPAAPADAADRRPGRHRAGPDRGSAAPEQRARHLGADAPEKLCK